MYRKINIFIYALLLMFVVTAAYAPDIEEVEKKDETPGETRLIAIEKKLDALIADNEDLSEKLEEIQEHLKKIESLIRTRT